MIRRGVVPMIISEPGAARSAGVAAQGARATRLRLWSASAVVGLLIVLAWEALARLVVGTFWLSTPTAVGGRIVELALSGELAVHLWATGEVALYGLALGMIVGVFAGLVLGSSATLAAILQPFIMFFYALPRIALAPLFIMYLGIGVISKVALTFTIVVFIALFNTYEGVRAVDRDLVDALRTMRANRAQIARWVVLPSVTPFIIATLRIGIGLSLIGAIVAELISASRGIGWYMQRSAGTFDVTGVFAGMIVLGLAAVAINGLVTLAERSVLAWRSS